MKLLAEPRTRERWTKGEGGILSIEERKSNQNDPKEEKGANRRKDILIGAKKQEKKCEDEARHLDDLGRSSQEGVYKKKKEGISRDFPGGPMAKTPRSQGRRPGFDPWSGNYDSTRHS